MGGVLRSAFAALVQGNPHTVSLMQLNDSGTFYVFSLDSSDKNVKMLRFFPYSSSTFFLVFS